MKQRADETLSLAVGLGAMRACAQVANTRVRQVTACAIER